MQNQLQIFNYQENQVRTISIGGEPWFVAKDICEYLELGDTSKAVSRLSENMKGTNSILTPGGNQDMLVVSEAGLYKLVFTSRKPEAEKFTDWIATEVIPSIRKTGSYSIRPMSSLQVLQQAVNALVEQEQRVKQLETTTQTIKDTIITQPDNWREDINRMFNKIVENIGGKKFQELRAESYKLLEERARVDLTRRLTNLRGRLLEQGASKTTIRNACKLDIIEQDPKLREIYATIIKEYTIKHVA